MTASQPFQRPYAPATAEQRMGFAVTDLTIGHILARQAEKYGDRTYLHYIPDGRTYSYGEVHRLSNVIANNLLRLGIRQGEHVAVMLENCPEQLLFYFALGKIGAVAVPINSAARGQLLTYYVSHADCVAVLTDATLAPHFDEIRDQVPAIRTHLMLSEDGAMHTAGWTDYRSLEEGPDTAPTATVKFSDLAFLLYTSGTTGPSKAIMFPHAYALVYGLDQAENYGFRETDVIHISLPLFHANGLLSHGYGALVTGAKLCLSRRFSASNFWREVRETESTVLSLLGSMANILWGQPVSPDDRRHKVRQVTVAPAPSSKHAFEERYGLRVLSTYGLTDYGIACVYDFDAPREKLGSAGRARRGMQVRIVDDNDMPLPPGVVGEIVMRAEWPWTTSPGYYKMPEQTLAARRNFWFHSGDRGYFDEDGYLFFADRKKDSIRRRGENISAFEVEQGIVNHPAVADVAAFPVSSPLGEDEVACAVIRRGDMHVTEAELIEHCQKNMAYFMVPRYIRFVADMPRSGTHKVEKYKLQKEAQAELDAWWDREKAGIVLRRK
jgi:crotonobetaine/carnitine-CoA ligase